MTKQNAVRVPVGSRRRAGMTLVEIMIAMVVLGFGMLGIAAMQVRAITESSGGQNLTLGSSIARDRVEELMRIDWDDAALAAGAWTAATPITDPANVSALTFQRSERITDTTTTLKAIEVRVTWSDEKRQNRSVVLASSRLKEVDE